MMQNRSWLFALLLFTPLVGLAAEPSLCESFDVDPQPEQLPGEMNDLFARSNSVGQALCRSFRSEMGADILPDPDLTLTLDQYVDALDADVRQWFPDAAEQTGFERQLTHFRKQITGGTITSKQLPDFSVSRRNDRFGFTSSPAGLYGEIKGSCRTPIAGGCANALRALILAINPYKVHYRRITAGQTAKHLSTLSASWDTYLEDARAQNFSSVIATTFFERKHFQADHLVGPPPRQWFALQPGLIYGYADASEDGSNTDIGVAIEWIGVNWWQQKPVALGFSVTTVFVDYAGIKDVGHGVMIHIGNKFSVGWANHGGEDGIYLSLDLLQFFQNKQTQLGRFTERMKAY